LTHLVSPSDIHKSIGEILNIGKNMDKYPKKPSDEENATVKFAKIFYSDENINKILIGSNDLNNVNIEDGRVTRQLKSISFTAPIALKTAAKLLEIANSEDIGLEDGLKEELINLELIFSTLDSLEGLSALIEGRRPKYINL
jgi:hypothetical protein